MKLMRRMMAVGVMLAGLMLAGCLDSGRLESSFKTAMKPEHESLQMVFALELYVAKTGNAPASVDELSTFINEEKIPLPISADWQVKAQIKDGQCDFTFQKAGEKNATGNFSTTDLDYGKTLQAYLQIEKVWAGLDAPGEKH